MTGCDAAATAERASLVGGTEDPGARSVVALVDLDHGGLCTASLVAPHVLVTAKHCVQGSGEAAPYPASSFRVVAGPSIDAPEATFDVSAVGTTPGAWTLTAGGGTDALLGFDVAVVTLADAMAETPYAIRRDRPRTLVGMDVPVWGYGQTPEGDNGRKYTALAHVDMTTSGYAITGAVVCRGDSGGPMIDPVAGDLLGVASLGPDTCGDGPGVYQFVYGYAALIDDAIAAAGDCAVSCPDAGSPAVDAGAPDSDAGGDAGAARDAGAHGDGGPTTYVGRGGGGCSVAAPGAG